MIKQNQVNYVTAYMREIWQGLAGNLHHFGVKYSREIVVILTNRSNFNSKELICRSFGSI